MTQVIASYICVHVQYENKVILMWMTERIENEYRHGAFLDKNAVFKFIYICHK